MSATSEPVVVVSNDTHVGQRLVENLRPYCPTKYLDDFDRFAQSEANDRAAFSSDARRQRVPRTPNGAGRGHLGHAHLYQEEIFGPVVAIAPFDDDEVVAKANDTTYGLAASAWTNDLSTPIGWPSGSTQARSRSTAG